jgi:hypothetical protein
MFVFVQEDTKEADGLMLLFDEGTHYRPALPPLLAKYSFRGYPICLMELLNNPVRHFWRSADVKD